MALAGCPAHQSSMIKPDVEPAQNRDEMGLVTELPLFRRSIIPRALTWKRLRQPSSRASTLLTGCSPYLLTRITSVPECAVSSVGFLWGSAAVSWTCGVSVGSQKPMTRPATRPVSQLPEADDHFRVT